MKGDLMQALSDVGVGSPGRIDRGGDRALAMSPAGDRGLLRRVGILLGVSWDYHKSPPPPRPGSTSLLSRRFAVLLGGFAMFGSTMVPAAIIARSAQLYAGSSKEIFQSNEEEVHCDGVDSRSCWWW